MMSSQLRKIVLIDNNSDHWVMWISATEQLPAKGNEHVLDIKGPMIVAFHYFQQHAVELNKWINLLDKLAQEYLGRVKIVMRDISSIGNFDNGLNVDDFGSYRSDVPPRIYGMDKQNRKYAFHMLFNYRYMTDFCEKLLQKQMFQAVVLQSTADLDPPAQNYYDLEDQSDIDFLVMFYDPACYYWTFQLRMLRKLTRLLAHEDVQVVIINKSRNYLGVGFNKWSDQVNCHGAITFATPRRDGWDFHFRGKQESTRGYLRYIAQRRRPELKDYDAHGEPRGPEQALDFIRYLFE